MNRLNKLEVFYHERLVGTIALYQNRLAAFEYDSNWLAYGITENKKSANEHLIQTNF